MLVHPSVATKYLLLGFACLGPLSGCASLPSSGPTVDRITRNATRNTSGMGFRIIDIAPTNFSRIVDQSARVGQQATLADLARNGRVDLIAPGDVLDINIYEVGATLFGGETSFGTSEQGIPGNVSPSAKGKVFGGITVTEDGRITLPYVGSLNVAGRTPAQVQHMIELGLRGKSQSPQVLVAVRESIGNSIYVFGDVRNPGRERLTLSGQRLLDAVTLQGGPVANSLDTIVRITRSGTTASMRLGAIAPGGNDDLTLLPGDRIELIREPRSYSVFGATSRVSQISFDAPTLSIAEAVARAGGPNDSQADPTAVFLFRYTSQQGDVPVIYRLDLMKPESYFLAQRFEMHDKDVIYIANAKANLPAKFVAIINQLFSPFLTVRAISQ